MSPINFLKYLQFAYFSKPSGDRPLYRAVRRARVRSILEIGVGDARRAMRLVTLAGRLSGEPARISYTGIDLFEARPTKPALSLKAAYQQLTATGSKIKLLPGAAFDTLARSANSLLNTDLIVISADVDQQSLDRAWFYMPRMLHPKSVVYREQPTAEDGQPTYRQFSVADIEALARSVGQQRAA
ncbi:MAG: hypothetical protein OES79_16775 [Planctomycetota bacterium]|nr:hypothetical protein [Planctomycetota bacterium]